ncbi:hypothetical protein LNTAR_05381 [Lentisphaera araneosa HTCC2155]|uniref:Tetratricopeptide repeat protein n=1 Tax=Lentisphaera araneosa HTCC2155 TaxID=313628 RepID=A6DLR3_9BACT|nr:tetratricopeptide repeat protein [Lentisphaera araneosa]EDM27518.1 hypothetical protein LNTAR_05381 [Lentisphaera araneosa HTCC2155]
MPRWAIYLIFICFTIASYANETTFSFESDGDFEIEKIDHDKKIIILRKPNGELFEIPMDFKIKPPEFEKVIIPLDGASHRDHLAKRGEFKQELIREYQAKSIDPPELKKLVLIAIEDYTNRMAMIGDFPSYDYVKEQCREILKHRPKDPFTLAFTHNYLHQKINISNQSIKKYSPYVRAMFENWTSYHVKEMSTLSNTRKWLTELTDDPHQLRYAWWHLYDVIIDRRNDVENIKTLLKDNPKIHPWIMNMLKGQLNVKQAWDVRGSGYASTVKKEAWPIFHEHLNKAGEFYTKAFEINPKCPEAPQRMITIATAGQSEKTALEWFYEAVKIEFDYYPVYNTYIWAIQPRWGGSQAQLVQFGKACAATKRYDTQIPLMIWGTIRAIRKDYDNRKQAWAKIQEFNIVDITEEMLLGYYHAKNENIRFKKDPINFGDRYLELCIYTEQFNKIDKLEQMYSSENLDFGEAKTNIRDLKIFKSAAHIEHSEYSDKLKYIASQVLSDFSNTALSQIELEDLKTYLEELKTIQSNNSSIALKPVLDLLELRIKTEITLQNGEWVEIDFTKDLANLFTNNISSVQVIDKSSVIIDSIKASSFKYHRAMDSHFEIEYEVEHLDNYNQISMFTFVAVPEKHSNRVSVHIDGKKTLTGHEVPSKKIWTACFLPKAESYKMNIKLWEDTLQYDVNDGNYFDIIKIDLDKIKRFQIGASYNNYPKGKFKLSNLRFRIHKTQNPDLASNKKHREYLQTTKLLETNAAVNVYLGNKLEHQKKFTEAKTYFEKAYQLSPSEFNAYHLAIAYKNLDEYEDALPLFQKIISSKVQGVIIKRSIDYTVAILLKAPNNDLAEQLTKRLEDQLKKAKGGQVYNLKVNICKLAASMQNQNKVNQIISEIQQLKLNKGQKNKLKKLKKELQALRKTNFTKAA